MLSSIVLPLQFPSSLWHVEQKIPSVAGCGTERRPLIGIQIITQKNHSSNIVFQALNRKWAKQHIVITLSENMHASFLMLAAVASDKEQQCRFGIGSCESDPDAVILHSRSSPSRALNKPRRNCSCRSALRPTRRGCGVCTRLPPAVSTSLLLLLLEIVMPFRLKSRQKQKTTHLCSDNRLGEVVNSYSIF